MFLAGQIWENFDNADDVRKKFPELLFRDNIGRFKIASISIYGSGNASNECFYNEKTITKGNSEISQVGFYFVYKNEKDADDFKAEEIYINLSTVSKKINSFCYSMEEYYHIMSSLHFCIIEDKNFKTDDFSCSLVYSRDNRKISGVFYKMEINEIMYCSLITTIGQPWIYSTDKDTTAEFLRNIHLNSFLKELYSSFII